MSRKEDFEKSAMDYCEDHSHCIYFELGAEYGYQYAIDKACEWLNTHSETDYFELIPDANYCGAGKLNKKKMIDDFRKAMEE